MLALIIEFITSALAPILKNPKALLAIAGVLLVFGIWLHGCNYGRNGQKESDDATVTKLKAKIDSIEHAPVKTWTETQTTRTQPPPDTSEGQAGVADRTPEFQRQLDSLQAVLGDTVGKLHAKIADLAAPVHRITPGDTLRIDSTLIMPYTIDVHYSPLDRILAAIFIPGPTDLHRQKTFERVTMPPEPAWYDYTPIGWIIRLLRLLRV